MAVSIEKISIALPPEMVAQVRQAGWRGGAAGRGRPLCHPRPDRAPGLRWP